MYQQLLVDRILARVRYTYRYSRCTVLVATDDYSRTVQLYIDTAVVWQQLYCMAIRILSIMATMYTAVVATVLVWLQPHCNSCMTAIRQCGAVRYYGSYLGTQYCMATVLDLARSSQIQIYQQLATCTAVLQLYQYRYYQEFLPGMATCTCTVYCSCRYLKNIKGRNFIVGIPTPPIYK